MAKHLCDYFLEDAQCIHARTYTYTRMHGRADNQINWISEQLVFPQKNSYFRHPWKCSNYFNVGDFRGDVWKKTCDVLG